MNREIKLVAYYNKNNELHREDGPTITYNTGNELWYSHDQLHREDGPSIVRRYSPIDDLIDTGEWYLNGISFGMSNLDDNAPSDFVKELERLRNE